jgi:NAD(P)-dependent dehydrogenase (short-subunit alcohol dehydrogenase family)
VKPESYLLPTSDKIIWVTGGAGYLGTPVVATLDALGVKTVCLDLPGKAEAMVKERGLKHTIPISADLTDLSGLGALVERICREHGVPDGLAHLTFASSSGKTMEQISADDFNRTLTLALTPAFALCREVALRMASRGRGSIVMYSSMYGLVSPDPRIYSAPMAPNPIDYGTSKAGIVQMVKYLAVHYGPKGVRFNAIAPGPFPNPKIQRDLPQFIEKLQAKTALNRIGRNEEVVGPTLFLLGDGASYVTGHCLTVDGGWTAW